MSYAQLLSAQYVGVPAPDQSVTIVPRSWKRDQSKTAVLAFHGAGGRATSNSSGGYLFGISSMIADYLGLPVVSMDAGADGTATRPDNWADPNCMTSVGNGEVWATGAASSYLSGQPGGAAAGVLLLGVSMGGMTALDFAARNTGLVKGCLLVAPAVDGDYVAAFTNGNQNIETAYGGVGSTMTTPGLGDYNNATAYVLGNVVKGASGRVFRLIVANSTGNPPPASGNNAQWNETLWSTTGSNAAPSFSPSKNTAPLAAAATPILLAWTGNDGVVVPVSGAGVTPPIYSAFAAAVGASCTLMEIVGDPAHNLAAPTLALSPSGMAAVAAWVIAHQ